MMGVSSAAVFDALTRLVPDDAVITRRRGQPRVLVRSLLRVRRDQSVLMSGYLGSIGFGFPAAMGAWAAAPDRPIIAVTGDGGFGQYLAELTTAVKYDMNITHVLLNNSSLGKITKEQRAGHFEVWQTALHNPDFAEYARSAVRSASGSTDRERARRRAPPRRSRTTARRWSRSSPTPSSSDDAAIGLRPPPAAARPIGARRAAPRCAPGADRSGRRAPRASPAATNAAAVAG